MGYNLSDRGRQALEQMFAHVGRANPAARGNVEKQFSLSPTAEQRLEDMSRESNEFLGFVNVIGVRDQIGEVLALGAANLIAKTRTGNTSAQRRPEYIGDLDDREYRLYENLFDSMLQWAMIDHWSKFPDFANRYAAQVARSVALSRIMVGFNGEEYAVNSDKVANPLGEDVNVGWLQKLRLERPDHVMGRATETAGGVTTATGAAQPIYIGNDSDQADGDYKNVDALAYDMIGGMPSWARNAPGMTVIVSSDLVDEKYFPMVNRALSTTIDGGKATSDEVVRDVIMSTKQIGGKPAMIVPFFPEGTMLVTPLASRPQADDSNLSIYYQEGSRRRFIRDEPENLGLVDYNSVNEGYVIESTDHAVLAENITFGARP